MRNKKKYKDKIGLQKRQVLDSHSLNPLYQGSSNVVALGYAEVINE